MPAQCPTPEVLAAYLDRNLPTEERSLVERHLVGCTKCRRIVAQVVRSEDAMLGSSDKDLEERSISPDNTSFIR
jgi:anti-sigma factor RsiW